jgi:hypothetical protein
LEKLFAPLIDLIGIIEPVFFEQRKNLGFDDAAIPVGVILKADGTKKLCPIR